jgi:glycosyltransferase involved in cell wall biosynthesis
MSRTITDAFKKKTKKMKIHTIAVIPCLNEAATIGSMVLKTRRYVDAVLVVDDGSVDDTAKIAREAGAVILAHKTNMGKGAAIKTGFNYALRNAYHYAVTLDGDGQHNPEEIPVVVGSILNNGHDISLGIRAGNRTEMPRWRKIGKRILDYSTSLGNGGVVTDSQCGFRAFNHNAIEKLTPKLNGNGFSIESEQLILSNDLNLKVKKVGISCRYENLKNTSKQNPATHGFHVLSSVIKLIVERRPLLLIGVPGFILTTIGLLLGIYTLQYYNQTQIFLLSYILLICMLLIIGTLSMFMGLVLNVLSAMVRRFSICK